MSFIFASYLRVGQSSRTVIERLGIDSNVTEPEWTPPKSGKNGEDM